jgi:hypothetical protein
MSECTCGHEGLAAEWHSDQCPVSADRATERGAEVTDLDTALSLMGVTNRRHAAGYTILDGQADRP